MSHPSPPLSVQLQNVEKWYGLPSARISALRGVSLNINQGERVAILGRSGSGKSTLLNLIAGLDRPSAGNISVQGKNLAPLPSDALAAFRLSTVGMVFQAYHLIPSRTALENVALPLIFAGRPKRDRIAAARRSLEEIGLGDRLSHLPGELSGGERQRVAIARALVNHPPVLLADEPTGNLDTTTASQVIAWLLDHLQDRQTTLLLVTHDEELARRLADRVVRMQDGQIAP